MSKVKGLGFGGLLLGFGAGWIVFDAMQVTSQFFGYFLLFAGALIVASSLVSWTRPGLDVGGLTRGLMIGLLISLVATSGSDPFIRSWGIDTNWGPGTNWGDSRAQETRTLAGNLTVDGAFLDIDSFNGPITVSTWAEDEYSISILIKAKGTTDGDAEENLDDIEFDLTETVVGGVKSLVLRHNVPNTKTSLYTVIVEVKLPADSVVSMDLDSSNGWITLSDITGGDIDLSTSNGALDFEDVTADEIYAETSNGGVRGTLEAPVTYIGTSNGGIHLTLPSTVTGRYILKTSNAGVGLELSSSSLVGYDVDLSTSNGVIDLDLPNLDYGRDTRTSKEARTVGFSAKPVQVIIDASTSNAGMTVGD
jgi:DUF4097 and DUF4098 domain-containing protein YvlB